MAARRTLRLVVNGKIPSDPGKEQAYAVLLQAVKDAAAAATIEIREAAAGEAEKLAAEAVGRCDSVLAVGGDGTINEVINGVLHGHAGTLPAVGVVPFGTANDLARSIGLPLDDPAACLRLVLEREPVALDVGEANGRYFVNVATGGIGTEATSEAPEDMKQKWGKLAYLVNGVRQLMGKEHARAQVVVPGLEWEGEFLVLAVGNGRQAGGGWPLCPQARMNDGLLDLLVIPSDTAASEVVGAMIGGTVETLQQQAQDEAGLPSFLLNVFKDLVVSQQVPWVEIRSAEPIQLNLDGEPLEDRTIRVQVHPGRLRFYLPEDPAGVLVATEAQ